MAPLPTTQAAPSSNVVSFKSPITEQAYIISQSILMAMAIINTIFRTVIRWKKFKKLFYDDIFLFLALGALVTSTVFGLWTYTVEQNLDTLQAAEMSLKSIMYSISGDVLLWLSIYCVKFSFMVYFRGLLRQQPRMTKWWWVVLCVTILCAFATVFSAFWVCPMITAEKMVQCISGPEFLHDELITVYVSVFADIVTDIMLLSIPSRLLWELQIKPRQKIVIAIVLCCSVFMIAIAILRGVSTYIRGTSDQVWTLFWINTQANVAVIMVCFTAWRTFYVDKHQSDADRRARNNVQSLNFVQTLPQQKRSGCWPFKKRTETFHEKQLRESREAQNGLRWDSNDPTINTSRDTHSARQGHGTRPGQIPRAFLRPQAQDNNIEMAQINPDSLERNMGIPELRRISRLQPGDRVLVFSERMAAVSTESFV